MDGSSLGKAITEAIAFFAVVSFVIGFSISALAFWLMPESTDWHQEAIKRGYALHCPTTGEFAWKGECEDDSK
ncbi:MAG: hypothetical protein AAGE61_00800 [Pseudomonadota bacterium]